MRVANRAELSEILGVSVVTVDNWTKDGCPYRRKPVRKGVGQWEFEVGSVVEWRLDRERKSALGDLANVTEIEARRRKLAAEAAMAEHDLAVAQGAATAIADAESVWCRMVAAARSRILGIGSKLGPQVAIETEVEVCRSLIDGAVNEALAELSGFDPGEPGQDEPGAELNEDAIDGRLAAAAAIVKKIRNAAASSGRKDKVVELCDTAITTIFGDAVSDESGRAESAKVGNRSNGDAVDAPAKANSKRVGRPKPKAKSRGKQ